MSLELLAKLCRTPGIPGREEQMRQLIHQELSAYADDFFDRIAGIIFVLSGW